MTRWRIAGLIIVTLLAAWLVLRSCLPEEPAAPPVPPPAREVFHASQPLRVLVTPPTPEATADVAWLQLELRRLLGRGKMKVAPLDDGASKPMFTLRVTSDGKHKADLELIAPDGVVEQRESIEASAAARWNLVTALMDRLPRFLKAERVSQSWSALVGTDNAAAYETFLAASLDLLGPTGTGFTHPLTSSGAHSVEKLETLTRSAPKFARARGLLAAAYLTIGGQDQQSTTQLAESTAQRALSADPDLPDAIAAQGIVHARRNDWIAARERFERALQLDGNSIVGLEGLGCMLADAGDRKTAVGYADRAVRLQPGNRGAQECRAYADGTDLAAKAEGTSPSFARVSALRALLARDFPRAQQLLEAALSPEDYDQWAEPMLRAAENRKRAPKALQAITLAASESRIDAATEIFAGVALRQADFALNRMARLQRQKEPLPLRILWLPETSFLRKHAAFRDIVDGSGLPAYWQEHGPPDVCNDEPKVYGCKTRGARSTGSGG